MVARGLRDPLLIISDDAPGLRGDKTRPPPQPQTALCHPPARNVLAKVPVEHQAEVQAAYWAIFNPTGEPPGEKSIAVAPPAGGGLLRHVRPAVPLRRRLLERRPDQPVLLPALPRRAPQADPSLELHRAHIRRDPTASQGHRPAPW